MFRKLLDWICPVVSAGQVLPWGFSRGPWARPGEPQTDFFRILLPVWLWYGKFRIADYGGSHVERGWWIYFVCIKFIRMPYGFDIQVRAASQ